MVLGPGNADVAREGGMPVQLQAGVTIGGRVFHTDPVVVPGMNTSQYSIEDALGTSWQVAVPKSGVIMSVWGYDSDDELLEYNIILHRDEFTSGTNNDAYAPVDAEKHLWVGPPIVIDSFKGYSGVTVGGFDNVGFAYVAPKGFLYGQCVTQGDPTYAAADLLTLFFTILPDLEE